MISYALYMIQHSIKILQARTLRMSVIKFRDLCLVDWLEV